jgi:hypothetical protein
VCGTHLWYQRLPAGGGYWEIEDLPRDLVGLIPTRWDGEQTPANGMCVRVAMSDVLIPLVRDDFRALAARRPGGSRCLCGWCGRTIRGRHLTTASDAWLQAGGLGSPPPEAIVPICNVCAQTPRKSVSQG